MEANQLIERFAEIQGISYEEANQIVGASTDEEILQKIYDFTKNKIEENSNVKLNRKQRRALKKKTGMSNAELISDTAKKLNYINLIQKLRELNERQENENETAKENDVCV